MRIYIVLLQGQFMGVYSCPTDANTRMKQVGEGAQMVIGLLNSDFAQS